MFRSHILGSPQKSVLCQYQIDAAKIGFDDDFIYQELNKNLSERQIPFEQISQAEAWKVFEAWQQKVDKTVY